MTRGSRSEEYLAAQAERFWDRVGEKGEKIIGVKDASLIHKSAESGDALSGLTQTKSFYSDNDWYDLRGGSARIELVNSSGSTVTLRNVTIRGRPVTLLGGEEGYIHDSFSDPDDIEARGEVVYEFGSEDVIDRTQLEKLADFYWKYNRTAKHIYTATMTGMIHWLKPGEWYTYSIGSAGLAENIDATVECLNVRMMRRPGEVGETSVTFREIESAWKYDSSAVARFIASGGQSRLVGPNVTVTVASQYFAGQANVFCDGTDDDVDIQKAVDLVSGAGGGVVRLSSGTFHISGSIDLDSDVVFEGEGSGTVIIQSGDDYAIDISGGSGTEKSGAIVRNMEIRRSNGTSYSKALIYATYSDDMEVSGVVLGRSDGCYRGIHVLNSDGILIDNCLVYSPDLIGIALATSCTKATITRCTVDGEATNISTFSVGMQLQAAYTKMSDCEVIDILSDRAGGYDAISVTTSNIIMSNIVVRNCDITGAITNRGIYLGADGAQVTSVVVEDVDSSLGTSYGIHVAGDDCVLTNIVIQNCAGVGVRVESGVTDTQIAGGRSTGNTTNYTDAGTNTVISSFTTT